MSFFHMIFRRRTTKFNIIKDILFKQIGQENVDIGIAKFDNFCKR